MFKSMTIATKLNASSGGFSALVTVAFAYILITINAISTVIEQQQQLVEKQIVLVSNQSKQLTSQNKTIEKQVIIVAIDSNFRDMRAWLLDLSVSWLNEAEENAELAQQRLSTELDNLASVDAALSRQLKEKSDQFYQTMLEAVDAYVDENRVKGNSLIADARVLYEQVDRSIRDFRTEIDTSLAKVNEQVASAGNTVAASARKVKDASDIIVNKNSNMQSITVIILVLSTLLSLVFSIILRREICTPINRLRTTVEKIEQNSDLTERFEVISMDEIGITGTAFNKMMEQFAHIIKQVKQACDEMDNATNNLVEIMQNARDGVISQEKATDQVAAAINQMATTVQEVATHTETASHSTQAAKTAAEEGRNLVQTSVAATQDLAKLFSDTHDSMSQVEKFSNNIGSVLDVIRSISDQTNLLALNAAIEAARAGEAGRGFAVVADEVRTLAQRTQESTQEIDTMISSLQSGTEQAVTLMDKGNSEVQNVASQAKSAEISLRQIENQVNEINDLNTMIATSAEQQSVVAEEINRNVVDISDSSTATTEAVEATVKSSENLLSLSQQLEQLVSQFKV